MKITLFAAAIWAAVTGYARADEFADRLNAGAAAFKADQAAFKAARAAKTPAKTPAVKSREVVDRVLEAMNDGNEAAGAVAEYVKAKSLDIRLDAALPDAPRVLGPRIAEQASEKMLAGMPACAEKEYMRLSMEVRTWLELGGEKAALPVVDGYNDQAMAARYKIWLDNGSEMALEKIGQATKTEGVYDIEAKEKDPAKINDLEAANKAFVNFLLLENDWRRANAFRLK